MLTVPLTLRTAHVPLPFLGQVRTVEASTEILKWLAVIVVAAIVVIVVAVIARRILMGEDEDQSGTPGFTLGDLRKMHERGELSDEEYDTARRGMIARSRAMMETPADDRPAAGATEADSVKPPDEPTAEDRNENPPAH